MRNLSRVFFATLLCAFSLSSIAQRGEGHGIDIQLNLAPIAFSNFSVFGGYHLEKDITLGGVIGYQDLDITITTTDINGNTTEDQAGFTTFYIAPEFRYYFDPSRRGNDRWYGGGYLKYRSRSTKDESLSYFDDNGQEIRYDLTSSGVSAGIVLGYTWSTRIGLTFGVWTGLGYYLFDVDTTSVPVPEDETVIETSLPGIDARFGINVGYRF